MSKLIKLPGTSTIVKYDSIDRIEASYEKLNLSKVQDVYVRYYISGCDGMVVGKSEKWNSMNTTDVALQVLENIKAQL